MLIDLQLVMLCMLFKESHDANMFVHCEYGLGVQSPPEVQVDGLKTLLSGVADYFVFVASKGSKLGGEWAGGAPICD